MSDGVMFEDHRRAFGKPDPDILAWRAPSSLMNPSIRQERLDQEQRLDPIRFKREYLAEFIEGLAAFLPRHLIDRAVQKGREFLDPRDGIKYVVAVDASQGGADAFTISVVHAEGAGADLTVVQDYVEGRATRGDSVVVLEDIVRDYGAIAQRYGQKVVYGDRLTTAKHGGWIVEAFRRHGIEYRTDHVLGIDRKPRHLTASDAYVAAEPLFTQGRIKLLDHEIQTKELGQLERRALPGGDTKVTHPKGDKFHDDHSNATCLAAAIASWLRAEAEDVRGLFRKLLAAAADRPGRRGRGDPDGTWAQGRIPTTDHGTVDERPNCLGRRWKASSLQSAEALTRASPSATASRSSSVSTGCEHVFRMVNGNKVLIRRAGHEVERLEPRFEACPTCGQQHMLVGTESLEPGDCPRTGWSWTTGAPRYPTGGTRTLQTVSAEARSFNEGMAQLEREVRRG